MRRDLAQHFVQGAGEHHCVSRGIRDKGPGVVRTTVKPAGGWKFFEGNWAAESAAESYAEGKRRVPILSTASDMQTAGKLNSRAEGNRGTQVPSPASDMQTAATGGYRADESY